MGVILDHIEQLRKVLSELSVEVLLNKASNLDDLQRKELVQSLESETSRFLSGLSHITDQDDAQYFIAVKYVECKANWIQMNLQVNYQTVLTGKKDEFVFNRAALMSAMLAKIEPFISQKDVLHINNLLAERLAG
ncbi:hypothetical protein GW916_11060 [bacterium]|nr:hypothetical protein [bacterium]